MNIRPAKVIFVLGRSTCQTKGVPAWCGLALQANLLHVMLEGKLNMESILILLLKRRPAYSLKKLIFGEQEAAVDKLEQSFKCLSDYGVSCALQIQQIDVISTLVSGKDCRVLPTGFRKSCTFQMLVRIKQIMAGKTAGAAVSASKYL